MRILLTGATGFVGSFVLARLLRDGMHEVALILRAGSDPWRISDLLARAQVIPGTLDRPGELSASVQRFAPEAVIHAAWSGVTGPRRRELAQVGNVTATVQLLTLAHAAGARHFVGLGSQAEYGPAPGRLDEQHPPRPVTLYGTSKLCASLLTAAMGAELGLRWAWLRLFSAYGPKDDPRCLVPTLCRSLLAGERPSTTLGQQRWDYLYVEDAAAAICRVVEETTASGVFNLGSGAVITIRELAERVRDLARPGAEIGFGEVPYGPHPIWHLEANVDRLRRATGWTPTTPLDEGLRRTVAWHRVR